MSDATPLPILATLESSVVSALSKYQLSQDHGGYGQLNFST